MTRRSTSEKADTRADEDRSHQIAPTRMMANKSRRSSPTHIAGAIARLIEVHQESSKGGTCTPCAAPSKRHSKVQKPMCRQTFAAAGCADRRSALSCRHSLAVVTVRVLHIFRIFCSRFISGSLVLLLHWRISDAAASFLG
jgi:hypothetical protein